MRINLLTKFIFAMFFVAVMPIAFLGYQLIKMEKISGTTARLKINAVIADKIASNLENYVREIDKKMLFLTDSLGRMNWANKQILLNTFIYANKDFKEISVISNLGREILKVSSTAIKATKSLISYQNDKTFIKAKETKNKISRIIAQKEVHDLVTYFPSNKNFILKSIVSLNKITEMVNQTKIGSTRFVFIVDDSGIPLIYPPKFFDEGKISEVKNLEIVKRSIGCLGKKNNHSCFYGIFRR